MKRRIAWFICLAPLVGCAVFAMAEGYNVLAVPAGTAPTLDGVLSEAEWDDALELPLASDTSLFVKHAEGFVYLGVRTAPGAQVVGNVYIARAEAVEILHASHALGPATYRLEEGVWVLEMSFAWSCRTLGFSDTVIAEREAFLERNGWLATVVNLGLTEHMEYRVAIDAEPMRMLFRFDVHRDTQEVLTWPLGTNVGLDPGPLPQEAAFRPEEWCDVSFEPTRVGVESDEGVGELPLVSFTDGFYGFTTLVPLGWIEVQPGTFVAELPGSGLPTKTLMLRLVPLLTVEQVAGLLAPSLGLERLAEACKTIGGRSIEWRLHHVENENPNVVGELIDIALAQGDDGVLVVVLQAPRADHQVLYEGVFLQAIDGMTLIPLEPAQLQYAYESPEVLNDGWPTSSLDAVDMDTQMISLLTDRLMNGRYGGVRSLVVVKDGFLVHEAYFDGFSRETPQEIYSITKSISSVLVGIAVDKGLIAGVDVPIAAFFPEYAELFSDERKRRITIEHLLTHTSGLDWDEHTYPYEDPRNSEFNMYYGAEDWMAYVLGVPMRDEPGTRYEYNTGAVHLLSAILKTATGLAADEFADECLFGPLSITDYGWNEDPMGYPRTGATHGGLRMTVRDVAKFGQLYLDGGAWHGQRLISGAWVEASLNPRAATPSDTGGMGYLWFVNSFQFRGHALETFVARGFGGQTLLVTPSLDLVVVVTCSPEGQANTLGLHLMIYKAALAR